MLRTFPTVSKGFAQYWSVNAGGHVKDLAWSYKTPLPENVKIAGLLAFYNERADFIVDGERQTRPQTKFSLTCTDACIRQPQARWSNPSEFPDHFRQTGVLSPARHSGSLPVV